MHAVVLTEKLIVTQLPKSWSAFVESEVSSLCSQQPTTGSSPDTVDILRYCFLKIGFNIIFLSLPRFKKCSFFGFSE